MEQLEELLHQLRRSPQTCLTTPSTPYAFVRACVREKRTDTLLWMIDDPLSYGIFPDDASLVFLLNHFLVKENWRDAAKVRIEKMYFDVFEVDQNRKLRFETIVPLTMSYTYSIRYSDADFISLLLTGKSQL